MTRSSLGCCYSSQDSIRSASTSQCRLASNCPHHVLQLRKVHTGSSLPCLFLYLSLSSVICPCGPYPSLCPLVGDTPSIVDFSFYPELELECVFSSRPLPRIHPLHTSTQAHYLPTQPLVAPVPQKTEGGSVFLCFCPCPFTVSFLEVKVITLVCRQEPHSLSVISTVTSFLSSCCPCDILLFSL